VAFCWNWCRTFRKESEEIARIANIARIGASS